MQGSTKLFEIITLNNKPKKRPKDWCTKWKCPKEKCSSNINCQKRKMPNINFCLFVQKLIRWVKTRNLGYREASGKIQFSACFTCPNRSAIYSSRPVHIIKANCAFQRWTTITSEGRLSALLIRQKKPEKSIGKCDEDKKRLEFKTLQIWNSNPFVWDSSESWAQNNHDKTNSSFIRFSGSVDFSWKYLVYNGD